MSTLFLCSWMALAVDLVLFTALYFCVILLRVNDAGGKVGGDAFFNWRQQRYVERYLGLLTAEERARWYNVFIRHSYAITIGLFLVCVPSLVLSFLPA